MATRLDLLGFSTNADLIFTFTAMTGAATPPWSQVAAWAAGAAYQTGAEPSFVTYNGDLYIAAPGAPSSWTSAASFAADAANWVLIDAAANWQGAPLSLSGAALTMTLTPAGADGVTPATPIAPALTLTNATGGALSISGGSNNQVSVAARAAQMRGLQAIAYSYDLLAAVTASGVTSTTRLFYGAIPLAQGVS